MLAMLRLAAYGPWLRAYDFVKELKGIVGAGA